MYGAIFKYTQGTKEATSSRIVCSNAESTPKDYLFQPQTFEGPSK